MRKLGHSKEEDACPVEGTGEGQAWENKCLLGIIMTRLQLRKENVELDTLIIPQPVGADYNIFLNQKRLITFRTRTNMSNVRELNNKRYIHLPEHHPCLRGNTTTQRVAGSLMCKAHQCSLLGYEMELSEARQIIPPAVTPGRPPLREFIMNEGSGDYENRSEKRKREDTEEDLPRRKRQATRVAKKGKDERSKTEKGKSDKDKLQKAQRVENWKTKMDGNTWYKWAEYTAKSNLQSNCYVCSQASPNVYIVPAPWRSEDAEIYERKRQSKCISKDSQKISKCDQPKSLYDCMWNMGSSQGRYRETKVTECYNREWPIANKTKLTDFRREKDLKFECYERKYYGRKDKAIVDVGKFEGNCNRTWTYWRNNTKDGFVRRDWREKDGKVQFRYRTDVDYWPEGLRLRQDVPLADVWWACGPAWGIQNTLPDEWEGVCTRIMAIQRTVVLPADALRKRRNQKRSRRAAAESFQPQFEYAGYLDGIGQPRGIPHEFKARSEVAAGFESIFPIISVNKNTEWINYIYYNQQRFINHTVDALKALGEQLDATSRVAMQNRMVLDWMLAKEGGVCAQIGEFCCTFIPNNTAPDGAFTKALDKLKRLRQELKDNSGKNAGFDSAVEQWFAGLGAWRAWGAKILITILAALLVVGLVLGCVIPCIRSMTVRTLASQLSSQMPLWRAQNADGTQMPVVVVNEENDNTMEIYLGPDGMEMPNVIAEVLDEEEKRGCGKVIRV